MPLVISLPTSGKSTTSVVLDSRVVSLTTSWNALGQFWSMDIKDSLGRYCSREFLWSLTNLF